MNTKALFPCGGESKLILGTGTENQIFLPPILSDAPHHDGGCHLSLLNTSKH